MNSPVEDLNEIEKLIKLFVSLENTIGEIGKVIEKNFHYENGKLVLGAFPEPHEAIITGIELMNKRYGVGL